MCGPGCVHRHQPHGMAPASLALRSSSHGAEPGLARGTEELPGPPGTGDCDRGWRRSGGASADAGLQQQVGVPWAMLAKRRAGGPRGWSGFGLCC